MRASGRRRRLVVIGVLAMAAALPSLALAADVDVAVNVNADRHAIDQRIYGVNFADWNAVPAPPPYPLDRWGGNSTSRYNWKTDMHSVGSDWYWLNLENDGSIDTSQLPDGSSADQFLTGSTGHGAQPLLTVPLIGYVPKYLDGAQHPLPIDQARQRRWSFSIAKYGAQLHNECTDGQGGASWCKAPPTGNNEIDAGDGTCSGGAHCTGGVIVGNDPLDTSDVITPTFITDWMTHIGDVLGSSAATLYSLDNEPALWNSTHRDVHPTPLDYDEIWSRTQSVAAAMKLAHPGIQITGPAEWGWCAYFDQAKDAAIGPSCVTGADRTAHGGLPFLEWYLGKVCAYATAHAGTRLVDYLDIHDYPQGTCVDGLGWGEGADHNWYDCGGTFGETGTAVGGKSIAALRLDSLRELYDPDWISESWIGGAGEPPMRVIPLMHEWINSACPGVGLAITEYRWGSDGGATGALAQAEALAIFGREQVDLATRWVSPDAGSASEDAFRLYLQPLAPGKPAIAGTSVRARSSVCDPAQPLGSRPCNVTSYAVNGAAGQIWLLLFNHDTVENTAHVSFTGAVFGPAAMYRFVPDAAPGARIVGAGTVTVSSNAIAGVSLPPRTATILLLGTAQGVAGLPFQDGFEAALGGWLHP